MNPVTDIRTCLLVGFDVLGDALNPVTDTCACIVYRETFCLGGLRGCCCFGHSEQRT
ncbi:hypothetical protein E2C01_094414 [Portunus trituberculatus]|uniref:Uncharacterized protein n=1 Tax=Portunus trituberculatus TaxID=210409 RepID=A0A5B7JQD2_PORTR|nr:hypothetical protein [Portunus trituberculatus]